MTTYYVATLARYVLVDAEDEATARTAGHAALHAQYTNVRLRLGREVAIEIKTIRPATPAEIELQAWNDEQLAIEAARSAERA